MDVADFLYGSGLGLVSSSLYFAGLYASVRATARVRHPGALLAVSAAARLVLFLLGGYVAMRLGLVSGLGFLLAFPLVRYLAIARVRPREGRLRSA